MSYLQTALKVVEKNRQEKTEPRIRLVEKNKSIEEILDAILSDTMDRLNEAHDGRQYKPNAEIKQAEDEINRIYKAILGGSSNLSEFQDSCNKWVSVCQQNLIN